VNLQATTIEMVVQMMGMTLRLPKGLTALHLACQANQHEIAEILLQAGADPTVRDGDGNTPFNYPRGCKLVTNADQSFKVIPFKVSIDTGVLNIVRDLFQQGKSIQEIISKCKSQGIAANEVMKAYQSVQSEKARNKFVP
jgi:hypothetical protein